MRRPADNRNARRDQSTREGFGKGEQTRRAIISRALAIVSDVGYEGLSIGVLAEETKLSKSGLFAHFKSKEALQLGVIQEVVNRFTLRVVQPALAAPRGEPRLRVLFEKKLEWVRGEHEPRGCLLQKASLEYHNRVRTSGARTPGERVRRLAGLVVRCAHTAWPKAISEPTWIRSSLLTSSTASR